MVFLEDYYQEQSGVFYTRNVSRDETTGGFPLQQTFEQSLERTISRKPGGIPYVSTRFRLDVENE